eukprot:TRINITY_DN1325_c0_g1_i1.p1 TRINITY_DN1325_c0_g1~~TRINITY_DN1325_c0_g1_i1.p1  ORF type:complete len:222 (+),score=20.40 TRINITY_DN1325_c0_g1_i1:459-1124(+)
MRTQITLFILLSLSLFSIGSGDFSQFDWDWMNCHHGVYIGHDQTNATTPDHCQCTDPSKWGGVDCSLCLQDSACSTGEHCVQHFGINRDNYFNCVAPNPNKLFGVNGTITSEMHFPDCKNGEGVLNVFSRITGAPLDFNCTLSDCTNQSSQNNSTVICQTVSCQCTTWCNPIAKIVVDTMRGPITMACDETGVCDLNAGFLQTSLNCKAAVCESPNPCNAF